MHEVAHISDHLRKPPLTDCPESPIQLLESESDSDAGASPLRSRPRSAAVKSVPPSGGIALGASASGHAACAAVNTSLASTIGDTSAEPVPDALAQPAEATLGGPAQAADAHVVATQSACAISVVNLVSAAPSQEAPAADDGEAIDAADLGDTCSVPTPQLSPVHCAVARMRTPTQRLTQSTTPSPTAPEPAAASELCISDQAALQLEGAAELYFMVNCDTDNVCLMRDARDTRPLGLKLPLLRLQPAACDEAVEAVVQRLLGSLGVRSGTCGCWHT